MCQFNCNKTIILLNSTWNAIKCICAQKNLILKNYFLLPHVWSSEYKRPCLVWYSDIYLPCLIFWYLPTHIFNLLYQAWYQSIENVKIYEKHETYKCSITITIVLKSMEKNLVTISQQVNFIVRTAW